MILMHDQQNPITTSNYILYAPKPIHATQEKEREKETRTQRGREIYAYSKNKVKTLSISYKR